MLLRTEEIQNLFKAYESKEEVVYGSQNYGNHSNGNHSNGNHSNGNGQQSIATQLNNHFQGQGNNFQKVKRFIWKA